MRDLIFSLSKLVEMSLSRQWVGQNYPVKSRNTAGILLNCLELGNSDFESHKVSLFVSSAFRYTVNSTIECDFPFR